jgi:hypothetical protein
VTEDGPDSGTTTLAGLVARLEAAAGQLRGGGLAPEAAAAVVEECARSAAQASSELERLARVAALEPAPGQDQLI